MSLTKRHLRRIKFLLDDVWDIHKDKKKCITEFRKILADVESPKELHHFVYEYNWDDGEERLLDVINHPLCDQGTALLIYWLGEPWSFYAREKRPSATDCAPSAYNLLKTIEHKYLSGGFSERTIKVNPSNIDGLNYLKIQADWQREGYKMIPLGMTWPSPGRVVPRLQNSWRQLLVTKPRKSSASSKL